MFYYWEVIANSENQRSRALHLLIKVQTRASKDELAEILNDRIKVRITTAPIDGKANKHLFGKWRLKGKIKNILDPDIEVTQGGELRRGIEAVGMEFSLGLEYRIE